MRPTRQVKAMEVVRNCHSENKTEIQRERRLGRARTITDLVRGHFRQGMWMCLGPEARDLSSKD